MNILIDIGHPAHVHLYRNFYLRMKERGHNMYVTVKNLPSATRLLRMYGIPYTESGTKGSSLTGKALRQVAFSLKLRRAAVRDRIDIGVGSSISLAHASVFCRMRSVIFDDDDDEVQPLMSKYGHPFADIIVSPSSLRGARASGKALFYPGYHELAYLHPSRFTPDPRVLEEAGVAPGERFFIMRFNAFRAHHDRGVKGLSPGQKIKLVEQLESYGRVFITTEAGIEHELEPYQLMVSPEKAHSLLSFASMFIGDSQTMTSEAAVLGVPALRCNTLAGAISYLREQEESYGLTFAFMPDEFGRLQEKIEELLALPDLRGEWQRRRAVMLADKIDVTSFMIWLVENLPAKGRMADLKDIDFSMFR
jgi:predicted glycosyltransferase